VQESSDDVLRTYSFEGDEAILSLPTGDFWKHLFEQAPKIGVTGRRVLLIVLAALGAGMLIAEVNLWEVLALISVVYNLEPVRDCFKYHLDRTKSVDDLSASRARLGNETRAHRRRLRLDEPELPLSADEEEGGINEH
jgi:hypothetical protein